MEMDSSDTSSSDDHVLKNLLPIHAKT